MDDCRGVIKDTINDIGGVIPWDIIEAGDEDIDGGQGFVYVLLEEPDEREEVYRIKVGRSGDVGKRLSDLQTGNSRELRIWKKFPVLDAQAAERAAHQAAESKYERISGEWFRVPKNQWQKFEADIKRAVQGY